MAILTICRSPPDSSTGVYPRIDTISATWSCQMLPELQVQPIFSLAEAMLSQSSAARFFDGRLVGLLCFMPWDSHRIQVQILPCFRISGPTKSERTFRGAKYNQKHVQVFFKTPPSHLASKQIKRDSKSNANQFSFQFVVPVHLWVCELDFTTHTYLSRNHQQHWDRSKPS